MTNHITTPCLPQLETKSTADLFDNWFDPVETGIALANFCKHARGRTRGGARPLALNKTSYKTQRNTKQLAATVPAFSEDFGMLRM